MDGIYTIHYGHQVMRNLAEATPEIIEYFDGAVQRVYRFSNVSTILQLHRQTWGISEAIGTRDLISHLAGVGLRDVQVFEHPAVHRFVWRDATPYELALSIRSRSFLCHGTAAALHGLLPRDSRTIHVNREQRPKPNPASPLTQDAIDQAFSRTQRISGNTSVFEGWKIVLVEGKWSNRLGVELWRGVRNEQYPYTDLERTLIDIAVRPSYCEGVEKVLDCYAAARPRLRAERLRHLLETLGYLYPYHQAIGFYMQRAGFDRSEWQKLLNMGQQFRFFLCHGIGDRRFDETWQIYYPAALD